MTDDTSRRERALATVDEIPPDADMDWADAQETRSDYGLGFLVGYLAGSREEAEIRSEEVERLESVARGLKQCCEEYRAEIAALREVLSARDTFINFVRAGEAVAVSACLWTEWEEGQWEADCGLIWELSDDSSRVLPSGHGMKFCPGCGRTLTEKPYVEPAVEDEEGQP